MFHPAASFLLIAAMTAIPVLVTASFVALIARAGGHWKRAGFTTALLMAVQFGLAGAGLLRQWERRPPLLFVLVVIALGVAVWLATSRLGSDIAASASFATLIGIQAFRLPLEVTMHRAYSEGLMPVQMSYSGYNFDIVTGSSALLLSVMLATGHGGRSAIRVWNVGGLCLLANIVAIAIASLPVFRAFGPGQVNEWVAWPPFVWLPGVLVPAALCGHLLVWRKLAMEETAAR